MAWGTRSRVVLCALVMSVMAAAQAKLPSTLAAPCPAALPDAPTPQRQKVQVAADPPPAENVNTLTASANAPYQPLSRNQKFHYFLHHTFSPYTLVSAAYDATYAQMMGDPPAYGGGMQGWGKRMGAAVAGTETRSFFGTFLFPSLFHQDPRYFAMYHGRKPARAFHALKRVLVTKADDGHDTFNTSGLVGIAFTQAMSTAWVPERQRGLGITFNRMLGAVQGDATSYLLREFAPDLQRFFQRHAPKKVKEIEEKIPPQITGMPADKKQ